MGLFDWLTKKKATGREEKDLFSGLSSVPPPFNADISTIANWVDNRYQETKNARNTIIEKQKEYYRLVIGDEDTHQEGEKARTDRPYTVKNYILKYVDQKTSLLGDIQLKPQLIPKEGADMITAEILHQYHDHTWHENNMDAKIEEAVFIAEYAKNAYLEAFWNPEAENGLGSIDTRVLHPLWCYPDPYAKDIEDCRWFIKAVPTPLAEVRWKYQRDDLAGQENYEDIQHYHKTEVEGGSSDKNSAGMEIALLLECWVKDFTMETIEGRQVRKYPNWRIITVCERQLLDDSPSPYTGIVGPPIVKIDCIKIPCEYDGLCDVELLVPHQRELNKRTALVMEHLDLNANGMLFLPKEAEDDTAMISNRPGEKVYVQGEFLKNIRRESGIPINPELFTQQQDTLRTMDDLVGITDIARHSRLTNEIVNALMEASQPRIRKMGRGLAAALSKLGKYRIKMIQQFVKDSRIFRVVGDDLKVRFEQLNKFVTENQAKDMKYNEEYIQQNKQGSLIKINDPALGEYDIKYVVSSTMPVTREHLSRYAVQLFQAGIIDREAVLEYLDFPSKYKIIERMNEKQVLTDKLAQAEQRLEIMNEAMAMKVKQDNDMASAEFENFVDKTEGYTPAGSGVAGQEAEMTEEMPPEMMAELSETAE